jgi:hypothetical protein
LSFSFSLLVRVIPTIHLGQKVIERKYFEVLGAGESLRKTSSATIALWVRPKADLPVNQDLFNLSVGGPKEMDYKSRAGLRITPNGAFQSVARSDDNEDLSEITSPMTSGTASLRVTLGAEDDGSLAFFYGDLAGAFVEPRILSE